MVTCQLGDLAAGATTAVLIQVRAAANLAQGTPVTNNVTVGSATPDPDLTDNSASATTTVNQPAGGLVDLLIAKACHGDRRGRRDASPTRWSSPTPARRWPAT